MIDYNLLKESSGLQKKIDYYITPYNKELDFKHSMQFGDKLKNCTNMHEVAQKDWKLISDFVFKTDKEELRTYLSRANRDLYVKLKDIAVSVIQKRSPSQPKRASESVKNNTFHSLKALNKKSSVSKRKVFQQKIQESFESFHMASRKNLPPLANETYIKCVDTTDSSFKSINGEHLAPKASTLDLRKCESEQTQDVVSVISPLMKLLRDKQESKERKDIKKQKQIEKQSEYEFRFEEFAQSFLKPQKKISKSSLLKTEAVLTQTPFKISQKLLSVNGKDSARLIQMSEDKKFEKPRRNHRNMSSINVNEKENMFVSPEPRYESNVLLPPISQSNQKHQKFVLLSQRRQASSNSVNSYIITTKNSSQHGDSISKVSQVPQSIKRDSQFLGRGRDTLSQLSSVSTCNNSQLEISKSRVSPQRQNLTQRFISPQRHNAKIIVDKKAIIYVKKPKVSSSYLNSMPTSPRRHFIKTVSPLEAKLRQFL